MKGATATQTQSSGSLATANAPAITLPLRFVVAGTAALVIAIVLMLFNPEVLTTYHYNQRVIAVTHLVVLGWLCTVTMGAVYQLVPVALETRLHSERMARWQFLFHVIGVVGMVWMFWRWDMKQVGHFGSVLAIGVGLFVYNIARTLLRAKRNVVSASVASSLAWLTITVLAGLSIVAAKCAYDPDSSAAGGAAFAPAIAGLKLLAGLVSKYDPIGAMHAHAHAGVAGIFLTLIVGVSYKLIPMFTLSEIRSRARAAASLAIINIGLAGAFISILFRSNARPIFAAVLCAGFVLYGIEMLAILKHRKRKKLDWALKCFLSAVGLLMAASALAMVLSLPNLPMTVFAGQLENAYGFVVLMGVITLAIQGMLYKILPFIVWYVRYSPEIGRRPVPTLAQLYSERLQVAGMATYFCGFALATAAILTASNPLARAGCAGMALGVLLLISNFSLILSHFRKTKAPQQIKQSIQANATP